MDNTIALKTQLHHGDTYPREFWMGLLLDRGGLSVWVGGLGLLSWFVVSVSGLRLRGDLGTSPAAAADRATDST